MRNARVELGGRVESVEMKILPSLFLFESARSRADNWVPKLSDQNPSWFRRVTTLRRHELQTPLRADIAAGNWRWYARIASLQRKPHRFREISERAYE